MIAAIFVIRRATRDLPGMAVLVGRKAPEDLIERSCLGGNRQADFEADLDKAQQLGALQKATTTDPKTHVQMVPLLVARRVRRATAPARAARIPMLSAAPAPAL